MVNTQSKGKYHKTTFSPPKIDNISEELTNNKSYPHSKDFTSSPDFLEKMENITNNYLNYWKEQVITNLNPIYQFNNTKETENYISFNEDLIPLLKEAPKTINKFFPNYEKLILEYVRDSEFDFGNLFLYISTNCSTDEAIERIKKINRALFNSEHSKALPKIIIYVKFHQV